MNNIIVGRREQIKELGEAVLSPKPEMIALVGRRRVGKTYLIRSVYQEKIDFELTGLQHANKQEQLQNFVFTLGKYFPNFDLPNFPKSWLEAFHFLSQALESLDKQEKLLVFLDELPWLGTKKSGFVTGLGYFWNSWASKQHIVVVICGSAASWMIDKVINDRGGLHNRVTRILRLYPFTLAETEAYCQARNIKLNRFHILQIYMTMGGIPMYLDLLKKGQSAIQNIQNICFSPMGYLRNEFDRLYASLFENYQNHIQIIRALATKWRGLSRGEIIEATTFENGGMLSKLLEELDTSGFITIYNGYGKKKKESLYRLTDFYSLFYLTYIESLGKSSFAEFTQLSDLPKWKVWSGYAFENICLTHIPQIKKALLIAGISSSVSSFIARPKDGFAGTQIDLLIDRNDQSINICEIKFSNKDYELNKKEVDNIENKKRVFLYHTKTKKQLFITLITTYGVVENANRINYVDQVIALDDLFEG
ncbi:MAG: ATP-binding protein [Bacteroidota bacterium]